MCTSHAQAQKNIFLGKSGDRYSIPKGKFPKWDSVKIRWGKTSGIVDNNCQAGLFSVCYLRELQDLIAQSQTLPPFEKMKRINDFVNQIRYREDIRVYGQEDYWAIPQEFFSNELGDCEDYSIAKYYALRALGFTSNDLHIAVVKDININVFHAILSVKQGEKYYILDNRLYDIVPDTEIKHYQPIYSLSENDWWFYHE